MFVDQKSKNSLLLAIEKIKAEQTDFSGYLKIKIFEQHRENKFKTRYLFFSRRKIIFSGIQLISFVNNLSILKSYVPDSEDKELISERNISKIIHQANIEQEFLTVGLLQKINLDYSASKHQRIVEIIESYIIEDLETFLPRTDLEVNRISNPKIDSLRPIIGLEIDEVILRITARQAQWKTVNTLIPSIKNHIQYNIESPQWKKLSATEKSKIELLISIGQTIEEISLKLGRERLEIAQIFYKLAQKKLVFFAPEKSSPSEVIKSSSPILAVIDDSPILLKQFSSVVKGLGYQVESCEDALNALDMLLKHKPSIIFIDINMPKLSGFQLMKLIRSQPKLSSIPLVILTAEKTMMNQQRAKWSKSKFLSKPLSSSDIKRFVGELKSILHSLAPIKP